MDDQSGTGLPASIEAAWGVRERPNKGPRPALSLERIVAAAVRVAAADGLQAVSMSRVAADLGVSTMSLYRYVAAKHELLALMADLTFEAPPAPRGPEEGWREGLSRWAWTELAVYRRNPWVLRIPISGPPVTPNAIAWLEVGLECLRDTGLEEGEKLSVMLLVTGFVRTQASLQADIAEAQAAGAAPPDPEMMLSYGRVLARLTDPERFPALRAVIAAGVFDEPDDGDYDFVFGLERVLDGIETLIDRRRTGRG
ncbi:MAG TPA: TetR/AcrR family transcriptional regulator [Actinomycetota bacterium]|jgi:AcrR family transcriptional regulator|nr:TetR/AcrR family transcriptional regulator [Actinomycetota bacterium]